MRPGNRYAREAEARRTLGDLIKRKTALVAICRRCKHRRLLFPAALAETLGEESKVIDLQKRLRCGGCRGYGTANLHESSR
jgi:type II secretory pathway component PulJ